ncbi:Putative deoxyribonuclease RhsC [Marinomonas gallaica]|uniref:Deoxyribonuclease RhsC n=1 Tax=Marinomonas gallaica TaxID=1806667 RepID=A0A1C3JLK2_9GAMM|nr:DUF6531 domain-containing protein [Marinomonas gallaica]SBT16041.1 Putative deoxyribonuclease RhsC [Marinomonas gallaica]SBT21089.1 Putative deoxyribonuclease RhsC [Marinomonas gallaica]
MSYSAKHFRDLSERDVKNIVHPRHAIASIKTGEMPIGISAFMNSFESKNVQLNRIFNKIENGDIFIIAFSRPFHGVISADGKPLNSNLTHTFQSKLKTLKQRRRKVSMPRKKASATGSGEEEESVFGWPHKDENGDWRMRIGPSSWDNALNAFDSFGVKKDTDGDTIISIGKEAKADPNLIEDVGLGDLVSGAIAGATGGKILNNAVPKKLPTPKNKPGTNQNGEITPPDKKVETGGEPISLVTGEEILTLADFDLPGPCPLVWERTYKSSHRQDVGLGHGWSHSFAEKLDIRDPDTVVYHTSEARLVPFVAPRVGQSITHETEQLILTYHGDNHYSIRPSDGAGLSRHFALKHHRENSLLLTEVSNAFNAGIQLHYNDNSRLSEILGTGNARWTLDYDGPHIRRIDRHLSDGSTHTQVRYHYDEQNDLIQASDRNKQSEHYAYDKHQISCRTLKSGYRFYFEWSDTTTAARCVHNWGDHVQGNGNPKHGIATYDYKFAWQPGQKAVAITDTRGGVERYRFNDLGLPIYHQDQEGGETNYTYDDYGNLLSTTDALGHVERRAYDDQQQLNQMTDSQGRMLHFKRNAAGEVVETVDLLGQPWRNTYTEQGLLHTETNPLGETTTYTYNVLGLPESIRNPMGDTWRYIWNDLGQLTAIRNPQGQHVLYQYTPMGDLQKITLPDGNSTEYHYNSGGQCTRIDTPDGQSQHFKYNNLGLLTKHQQGDGRITRYDYNGLSQVVKRTDSMGHELRYRYDGERNLIGLINEKGEHYQLTYDLNERLIEEVGFDGRRQRYEYNAVGHLIASEEYRAGSNICLSRLRYKRDVQGRLLEQFLEVHQGQATQKPLKQFAYDQAGRLIAAGNAYSTLKWDYDHAGRLTQVSQNGQVLRHELDAIGRRTQSTLPNGDQIQYAWDASHQNQSIHFNGHTVVDFTRDALGREIGRQHGNQLQTHSSYDPQGRLQAQKLSNAKPTPVPLQSSGTTEPD